MAYNGITPTVVAGKIKPTRIPIPPPMKIEDLMKKIAQLNLDQNILKNITPNITWKGNPLFIGNSIHYDLLHPKEALVASTLRLTPLQYLTYKLILISSARGYSQRSFPFRKSDAQKHLPIDVNRSSKLWEWFTQTGWLKTEILL
ncbi:Fun19p [Rhizophagus irregularis DAOM 197198w]|nr:Fun19p [Rhizophagus irregularis DAOM 197198w]